MTTNPTNKSFSPASRIILIESIKKTVIPPGSKGFSPASRIILIERTRMGDNPRTKTGVSVPQAGLF